MDKIILEFDDFHWRSPENCIDTVESLVSKYPKIKINLFTVPCLHGYSISYDTSWLNRVKSLIKSKNIILGFHGVYHSHLEFEHIPKDVARRTILDGFKYFEEAGLPFQKVFRGPNWGLNHSTIEVLKELNFTHIYNHPDRKNLESEGIKYIYYNWNLKDDYSIIDNDIIIAHGHTHNVCGNGIMESYQRLCKFLDTFDVEFLELNEI